MSAAISSVSFVSFRRGDYYLINYATGKRRFAYTADALPAPVKAWMTGATPTTTTADDGAKVTTWKEV